MNTFFSFQLATPRPSWLRSSIVTSIGSWGGFVSLEVKATEKLRFNTGYGLDDPKNGDLTAPASVG